jgi:hypothetical protein
VPFGFRHRIVERSAAIGPPGRSSAAVTGSNTCETRRYRSPIPFRGSPPTPRPRAGHRARPEALSGSGAEFVHDMLLKQHGVSSLPDPNLSVCGGPNRYAHALADVVNWRELLVGNVSFTWSFFHGGEHPSRERCSVNDCLRVRDASGMHRTPCEADSWVQE